MIEFTEATEIYWTSTPDHFATKHNGFPEGAKFEVRKHQGRFLLRTDLSTAPLLPMFIYPIGCATNVIAVLEQEHSNQASSAHYKAVRKELNDRDTNMPKVVQVAKPVRFSNKDGWY
jgi:hypothetical protein